MTESHSDEVHLVVGGYHYYFDTADLEEHPDSYFAHMLKDEWVKDKTAVITLDRNGKVFRYISYYLFSGYMDPDRKPILDLDTLLALRTEADFYGLSELMSLCDDRMKYDIDALISNRQNVGLSCDCFRADEEKSTDTLVVAMHVFRPPTVATSRLETYSSDSLKSYYNNVSVLLKYYRKGNPGWQNECSFAHKCFEMPEYEFNLSSCKYTVFSNWPLSTVKGNVEVSFEEEKAFIYKKGGYCNKRVPNPLNERRQGTYLYIFNSEHTGGRITTKVNGDEVSIEKPGECMALLPGCSYSVETVTSGHLVLLEFMVDLSCYAYSDDESEAGGHNDKGDSEDGSEDQNKEKERVEDESHDGDSGSEKEYGDAEDSGAEESGEDRATESVGEDEIKRDSDSDAEDSDDDVSEGSDFDDADASGEEKPLMWQVRDSYSTEITPERSASLTQAINTALETYTGVVICLSTYYPMGHSTIQNRRCETDPALLKHFDADLHAHLSTLYEVMTVTVAIKADEASGLSAAHVLDFPHDSDMRLKVVAPMQSVNFDWNSSDVMLLTGLLCFARE